MTAVYDSYAAPLYGLIIKLVPEEGKACMLLHETFILYAKQADENFPTFTQLVRCMVKLLSEKQGIPPTQVVSILKSQQIPRISQQAI
jgi:hypothetical protein